MTHPRQLLGALIALAVVVPAVLLNPGTGAADAVQRISAPRANPSAPLVGEKVTITGSIGVRAKRKVILQRRVDGRWVDGARSTTTSAGRYAFTFATRRAAVLVRVVARATDRSGVRRSAPLTIRTRPTQTKLQVTGTILKATATATVSPARPGRTIRLQEYSTDTAAWRTVALDKQTGPSALTWKLTDISSTTRYRILAAPWNGAPQYAGGPVTFVPQAVLSKLPQLVLTTQDGAAVTSKETYLDGTLQIDQETPVPMQIRGRGNSTWNAPKKPYRIKLVTKAPLLGLPSERDWVLLANYGDRSALRNWAAFEVARQTSLAWTPSSRFVDVRLNGIDLGLYQLVEQVEANSTKVPLAPGGMLLEVDQRGPLNGDPGFVAVGGLPISFKDPDDPTAEEAAAAEAWFNQFHNVLYSDGYLDPTTGYAGYVDLTSFADWYLVNEAMKNLDSDFLSSVFVTWDPNGKLRMGPAWDFDLSSGYDHPTTPGCCLETSGWWLRPSAATSAVRGPIHDLHWLARMTTDPAFLALLEERWASTVQPALDATVAALTAQQDLIGTAADLDWSLWSRSTQAVAGTKHADDHAGEAAFLQNWLAARSAWMDSQLS